MVIEDLSKPLSELSDEELMERILKVRKSRNTVKASGPPKVAKAKKNRESAPPMPDISTMSEEQRKIILAILEGRQ